MSSIGAVGGAYKNIDYIVRKGVQSHPNTQRRAVHDECRSDAPAVIWSHLSSLFLRNIRADRLNRSGK